MSKNLPAISMAVIGFNEADNLYNTFEALQKVNYPKDKMELIYVDSGSINSSVENFGKYIDKEFLD